MKIKRALFVGVDGHTRRLPEIEGKEYDLSFMYPIIGNGCGTVERVSLNRGVDMWVDEEGLLKENYLNEKATALYRLAYPQIDPSEIGVAGNAIIIDNTKNGKYVQE